MLANFKKLHCNRSCSQNVTIFAAHIGMIIFRFCVVQYHKYMRPSIVTWVYFTKFCGASKNSRKVFVILEIFVDFLERNTGYDRMSHIMSLPAHNRFDLSTHDITPMPEGMNCQRINLFFEFWLLLHKLSKILTR